MNPHLTVLVLSGDPRLLEEIAVGLAFEWPAGQVCTARDGAEALPLLDECAPDLVILDLDLPEGSGLEALKAIRQQSDVPVMVLSEHTSDAAQVHALNLGADEFVGKPFNWLLMLARIRALLRRVEHSATGDATRHGGTARHAPVVAGPLLIDLQAGRVEIHGGPVHLSQTEYLLLAELARNQGQPVPWTALLRRVWRLEPDGSEGRLRVALSRLRARLEALAGESLIETVRGEGYRLRAAGSEGVQAHRRSA